MKLNRSPIQITVNGLQIKTVEDKMTWGEISALVDFEFNHSGRRRELRLSDGMIITLKHSPSSNPRLPRISTHITRP